jgi:hypothetical protein
MDDIIARIDALLANTPQSEIEEFEVTRCLLDCRDEIIAARACAEMMLQGTGQRLALGMAERVINGQTIGAWISVSERLPETRTNVLAYDGNLPHSVTSFRVVSLSIDGSQWFDQHTDEEHPVNAFTHWMPLPGPPEAK